MTRLTFKRHVKLLVLLALMAVLLIAGAGDQRIIAYSVQGTGQPAGSVITYSDTLASLGAAATDIIQGLGAVRAASADSTW